MTAGQQDTQGDKNGNKGDSLPLQQLEASLKNDINLFSILERISIPSVNLIDLGKEYVRFLVLKITAQDFDGTVLSPSPLIASVWHQHILDTKAYGEFTSKYGQIHHNPHGVPDATEKLKRQNNTATLYAHHFGISLPSTKIWEFTSSPFSAKKTKLVSVKADAPNTAFGECELQKRLLDAKREQQLKYADVEINKQIKWEDKAERQREHAAYWKGTKWLARKHEKKALEFEEKAHVYYMAAENYKAVARQLASERKQYDPPTKEV